MTAAVEKQVIEILARHAVLDPSDIAPGMEVAALGLDSLGLVETIFAIEETFDISVPFNANDPASTAFDMKTVGSVVGEVERLIAARA